MLGGYLAAVSHDYQITKTTVAFEAGNKRQHSSKIRGAAYAQIVIHGKALFVYDQRKPDRHFIARAALKGAGGYMAESGCCGSVEMPGEFLVEMPDYVAPICRQLPEHAVK